MNAFIISDTDQILQIEDAWSRLHKEVSGSTLFHSFEAYKIWMEGEDRSGAQPYLLCYGSRKRVLALLPCALTPKGRLKFYLSGKADLMGALLHGNWHEQLLYLAHIRDLIIRDDNIRDIEFTNIRRSDPLLDQLGLVFKKIQPYIFAHDLHSWLDRSAYDEKRYLKHIPSKLYIKLKKTDSSIESTSRFYTVKTSRFPGEILSSLIKKMAEYGIRESGTYSEIIDMTEKFYDIGRAIVAVQEDRAGKVLSATILLKLRSDSIMGWIDLYDPSIKRVNIKNYLHIIEYARRNDLTFLLGTGLYDYKLYNFAPYVETLCSFYCSKSPAKALYYQAKKSIASFVRRIDG